MIKKSETPEEDVLEPIPETEAEPEPEVETPKKVEPTGYVMTEAEIESRYQAHLKKIRGGK